MYVCENFKSISANLNYYFSYDVCACGEGGVWGGESVKRGEFEEGG